MTCTRCDGSGFLNIQQVDHLTLTVFDDLGEVGVILDWIDRQTEDHDVMVCDCCGDGDDWYGEPGTHDAQDNGPGGPYVYNGGLPECN